MKIKSIIILIICMALTLSAGFFGSVFTQTGEGSWYTSIEKPFFNPPNWVFGPVWTVLYLLMGIALFLIIDKNTTRSKKEAYVLFGAQLFLNFLWSLLFFGAQSPLIAFIEIIILWASILLTIFRFYRISKTAAYLLVPYILWVSFAAVLNISIFLLN